MHVHKSLLLCMYKITIVVILGSNIDMSCLVMNTETRVSPLQNYTTVKPLQSAFVSDPLPVTSLSNGSNQSTLLQGSFSSKSSVLPGFKNTMKPVLPEEQPVKLDAASTPVRSQVLCLCLFCCNVKKYILQ